MTITAEYEWKNFCSHQHPGAGDYLRLSIELHDNDLMPETTVSRPFVCIEPQGFLQECKDFLSSFLLDRALRSLCREVTKSVMSAIQKRFQFVSSSSTIAGEPREFRLHLVLVVHDDFCFVVSVRDSTVENDVEIHPEFNEGEGIQRLLKKSKITKSDECCVICMEEFHVSDANDIAEAEEGYSIPCGHMFHHACILTWLLTTRKCPVCRFSMHQS